LRPLWPPACSARWIEKRRFRDRLTGQSIVGGQLRLIWRQNRLAVDGEWHSELPDGREVVVRLRRDYWSVRCGRAEARSDNLDVALAQAIRAETDGAMQAHEIDYPAWIRSAADKIEHEL
jgi:hypothetical protein